MQRMNTFMAFVLVAVVLGGCLGANGNDEEAPEVVDAVDAEGRTINTFTVEDTVLAVHAAAGAVSRVEMTTGAAEVSLPEAFWVLSGQRFGPVSGPIALEEGGAAEFLVTPFTDGFQIEVTPEGGATVSLQVLSPYNETAAFVSGALVYELMEHQRDHFPYRTPGNPSYVAAQEYFRDLFLEWGYEIVVMDEYGMNTLPQPDGLPLGIKPQSLANVYAYRPGTSSPDRIIAIGGHYDAIESTKEAAFDDTSGTIMTLALAKAFSEIETDVGLLFGLWGGEEDGLLGSQFFVRSNPGLIAQTILYVNLDVAAMAWPGPYPNPTPMLIASGPDGPIADALDAQARALHARYLPELPGDMQIYETVVEGQATGAGVNAQSDHTPFMSAGVPVYFPFTSDVSMVFFMIHKPADTLYNMTYYMGTGERWDLTVNENPEMSEEEFERGRYLNIRSFEAFMMLPFFSVLELDAGLWESPRDPSGALPLPSILDE